MNANTKQNFQLGTCTVPCGRNERWLIDEFDISRNDAILFNLRPIRDGAGYQTVNPGRFKRLSRVTHGTHLGRDRVYYTVVMSNTPMEVRTNFDPFLEATGRVLINGLGMGMVLEAILSKPDVTHVRVIEIDQLLIDLVGPHFAHDPRVEIICADAMTYKPERGARFDYAWHDIWDNICEDNLPEMAALSRKYRNPIAKLQGFWCRDEIRREARRYRR